jgi:hypothetical protein
LLQLALWVAAAVFWWRTRSRQTRAST